MLRVIGQSVAPRERTKFIRGEGQYLDDLAIPGIHYVAFVRSPHARARISRIDTSRVVHRAGVFTLTAGDLEGRVADIHAPLGAPDYFAPPRPLLPATEVHFVGEPVVVVLATSMPAAIDAAELVEVEYAPLDPVVDMDDALAPHAPRVHPGVPGNVLFRGMNVFGDVDARFAQADVRISKRFRTARITGVPLEPRGCVAIPDLSEDTLTLWASSQAPHIMRTIVAECLRMPESRLRVRVPDIGGGFGIKIHVYPEEVLVAYLARTLRVPVKWVQERAEDLQASAHCREQIYELEIAARKNGDFLALQARVLSDNGAFALPPQGAILQSASALRLLPGGYRFEAYRCDYVAVATNKSPAGAYRGVGQPASIFAIERLVDILAKQLRRDPADLRRQNLVNALAPSSESITANDFDNASFKKSLEVALERIEYEKLRAEQAADPDSGIGIGIAIYPENTGLGSTGWRARGVTRVPGFDAVRVRILPDGTVSVASSVPEIGQGHETVLAQIVAEELGVSLERIKIERTDTAATPYGTGCFASRGAIAGGGAAMRASRQLKQKIMKLAALMMECSEHDIALDDNAARIVGIPERSVSLNEIASMAYYLTPGPLPPGVEPGLEASCVYDPPPITFANGCHIVVARVDREVGSVEILRYLVAHDCGRVINPMLVDGQLRGAVAQGIGSTLSEQLVYNSDGQFVTGSLLDYPLPHATDVPDVELVDLENPGTATEGGIKGVGESGIIGAPAAIANAIADAVPSIGADLVFLPITPERVWRLVTRNAAPAS